MSPSGARPQAWGFFAVLSAASDNDATAGRRLQSHGAGQANAAVAACAAQPCARGRGRTASSTAWPSATCPERRFRFSGHEHATDVSAARSGVRVRARNSTAWPAPHIVFKAYAAWQVCCIAGVCCMLCVAVAARGAAKHLYVRVVQLECDLVGVAVPAVPNREGVAQPTLVAHCPKRSTSGQRCAFVGPACDTTSNYAQKQRVHARGRASACESEFVCIPLRSVCVASCSGLSPAA